jgi:hypothetical protein
MRRSIDLAVDGVFLIRTRLGKVFPILLRQKIWVGWLLEGSRVVHEHGHRQRLPIGDRGCDDPNAVDIDIAWATQSGRNITKATAASSVQKHLVQVERAQDRGNPCILGVERGNTRKPLGAADLAPSEASAVVHETQNAHQTRHVVVRRVAVDPPSAHAL